MMTFVSQTSILLLLLFYATTFHKSMSNNLTEVRCNEKDQRTLLIFKQGVLDPFNQLATWSSEKDCCAWEGVQCDNTTSRVTKLDLSEQDLEGEINLSLLELEFLNHLDLSDNDFNVASIPPIHNDAISDSNLHYLDLSSNYGLSIDNLHWLSLLSSLKYLNLSTINLPEETNLFQLLAMLPSLSELRLSNCGLNNTSPSLEHVNFTSLVTLDLSYNHFSSKSLYWLFNLSSDISHLGLGGIDLSRNFDLQWLSRLSSLKYLDLSWIDLHKETNWLLAMPPSLSNLYLRGCQLPNISPSLQYVNLTALVTLDLSYNNFNSELPHWLFNLSNDFSDLDFSRSSLHGEIPPSLFNHQNLKYLDLSDNMFSGSIPSTLGNLTSLVSLSIGSNTFSGAVSETHFSRLHNLEYLDLSNSSFAFHFNPEWIPLFQLECLYLANTNQGPKFPPWIYTQKSLDELWIASSGISFVDKERFMSFIAGNYSLLNMASNSISEDISNVMLNSYIIVLSFNNFTGRIPHLSPKVRYVDLPHNSFSGSIPRGWENLKHLVYVNLWGNRLFGEVPVELSNLTLLRVMNLGKNEFSGTIPISMSQNLQVVILRSNHFEGSIPPQLFNLSSLIHLDLSHNKLSGSIPQVVYNTTKMIADIDIQSTYGGDMIYLFTKGQVYECYDLHRRTIDLSANNLSGEIPSELFGLIQVQTLNLSFNHLTGAIPKTIGGMKNLESLDLSNNKLFGEIPQNMATLSFLEYLNISCNNFTGQIPIGTQLQSFDASSYIGNPELCGAPLTKCSTEEKNPVNAMQHTNNEDGDSEKESLYLGMGIGFAVGFWGICGSLLLFRKWRHMYYRFLDRVSDKLYVTYMVKFNTFLNR